MSWYCPFNISLSLDLQIYVNWPNDLEILTKEQGPVATKKFIYWGQPKCQISDY